MNYKKEKNLYVETLVDYGKRKSKELLYRIANNLNCSRLHLFKYEADISDGYAGRKRITNILYLWNFSNLL
jgi:hypothetical protein